jgi:DNA-binding Lrp family transcriptional regulator
MKSFEKLIPRLDKPLKIDKRPFTSLAKEREYERLFSILRGLTKQGLIRRFGAVVRPTRIGLKVNALVCWQVERSRVDSVAQFMSNLSQISHCYLRKGTLSWPYNLYTMIHARSKKEFYSLVKKISLRTKIDNYKILFTLKELKKTRFTPLERSVLMGNKWR